MDKNFSDILNIFKKLNESTDYNVDTDVDLDHALAKAQADYANAETGTPRSKEAYAKYRELYKQKHTGGDVWGRKVKEDSMANAEHHKSGAEFGGYWKGKDKSTPKAGMGVGGMEEDANSATPTQGPGIDDSQSPIHGKKDMSLEEEIMAEWNKFAEDSKSEKFDFAAWKQSGSKQKKPRGKHSEKNLLGKGKNGWNKDEKVKEDGSITAIGATGAATGTQNAAKAPNPAQITQDANKIKQGLTGKLPQGVDANKLSTALATATDTNKPLAGTQAQTVTNTLAPSLAKIAQDPTQANQLGQLIKKAGQQ